MQAGHPSGDQQGRVEKDHWLHAVAHTDQEFREEEEEKLYSQ